MISPCLILQMYKDSLSKNLQDATKQNLGGGVRSCSSVEDVLNYWSRFLIAAKPRSGLGSALDRDALDASRLLDPTYYCST